MSRLALSLGQIALLWAAATGLALWLYLHNPQPLLRRVSTLRFWANLPPGFYRRRRWLREPWAFAAQVLFLLLLILALANPRWGRTQEYRKVVMVIDTSIWSQAKAPGDDPWVSQVRAEASRMLNALPANDPVLLLGAEADAAPILPYTVDRSALRSAISGLKTSSRVADIPRALEAGRAALDRHGLLVYIGPGMFDDRQARELSEFQRSIEPSGTRSNRFQFLVRLVGVGTPIQNRGITRLALQRDPIRPDHWHLLTDVQNYSPEKSSVLLKLSVNGQTLGQRPVALLPERTTSTHDEFAWARGGLLEAEISPPDILSADDRAVIDVPSFSPARIAVFTSRYRFESELRAVLLTNPYAQTEFLKPGAKPAAPADVSIYDGLRPPHDPATNSIWFVRGEAPARGATAESGTVPSLRLTNWNTQHPVTRWVRTRDVSVRRPASLDVQSSDTILASSEGSPSIPLVLARELDGHKSLIIGFDPRDSNFPEQSAFPLLLAAGVEWMTHPVSDASGSVAAGELDLPGTATRIIAPSGQNLPFALDGSTVHFTARETGLYRLVAGDREMRIAVNAPALPSQRWKPTPNELTAVQLEPFSSAGGNVWRWLVALGMIAMWAEYWLFYSRRANQVLIGEPENSGHRPLLNLNSASDRSVSDRKPASRAS